MTALIPRWALALALLGCLTLQMIQHLTINSLQSKIAEMETESAVEKAVASSVVVELQQELADRTKKANKYVQTQTALGDSQLAAVTTELDRLRVALATGGSAATAFEACTARADKLSEVFSDCAGRYTEVASKADRIAVDRDALLALFPD